MELGPIYNRKCLPTLAMAVNIMKESLKTRVSLFMKTSGKLKPIPLRFLNHPEKGRTLKILSETRGKYWKNISEILQTESLLLAKMNNQIKVKEVSNLPCTKENLDEYLYDLYYRSNVREQEELIKQVQWSTFEMNKIMGVYLLDEEILEPSQMLEYLWQKTTTRNR